MSLAVSVDLENNPQYGIVVSSRKVAEGLSKQHKHVVRDLDKILESPNLGSLKNSDIKANIIPATYSVANQKRKYREYLLTKDGFTLYMFNIQGYNDFKWAYIQKFNEMEEALKQPVQQQLPMEAETPARKTWGGNIIMTVRDVANHLRCDRATVHYWISQMDYCGQVLEGKYLSQFKRENNIQSMASSLRVLGRFDVEAIYRKAGAFEDNKDYIFNYFKPECNLDDDDMKFAVRQADLLFRIAREIKDPVVKEMNLKAVTALMIDIGLWNDKHHGFNGVNADWDINGEGWVKHSVMLEANRYWGKLS